jgi:xanthine/uracil permease
MTALVNNDRFEKGETSMKKEFLVSGVFTIILMAIFGLEGGVAFIMSTSASVIAWALILWLYKGKVSEISSSLKGIMLVAFMVVMSASAYIASITYGGLVGILTGPIVLAILIGLTYVLGGFVKEEDGDYLW